MTCTRGRVSVKAETRLRLFADAAGRCQDPSCFAPLFVDIEEETVHFGEVAHIIAASTGGARSDPQKEGHELARRENLILLCANTHTVVDKAASKYSVELLGSWKRSHLAAIDDVFGVGRLASRVQARARLCALIQRNLSVFDRYGPYNDERFNPESGLPSLWRRHVRETIIPNNRAILRLLDVNRSFLEPKEQSTVEQFRIHVSDLEARHLGASPETRLGLRGTHLP